MRKNQDADVKKQERHKTQMEINRQSDKDRPREVRKGRQQTKEEGLQVGTPGVGVWGLELLGPGVARTQDQDFQ